MLNTIPVRSGTGITVVLTGADNTENFRVYFGKEQYRHDYVSSSVQNGADYIYLQGLINTTLKNTESGFGLNDKSYVIKSDFFGYSEDGDPAVSNVYLASVTDNGGSADDDGILSVDISGTPATSAVYYVQKYSDGGVAKFRWRLSTSESYTTGTTNTITAY